MPVPSPIEIPNSPFETWGQVTGGIPGTAPQIFVGSTVDDLATITASGYLNSFGDMVKQNDVWYINYNDTSVQPVGGANANMAATLGEFYVNVVGSNINLVNALTAIGTAAAKDATDNSKPLVASVSGTFGVNHMVIAADTAGTIKDGDDVAVVHSYANSSATPGTIRSFVGKMTSSATTMTSGNLVGLRGEVDYVGASGGFLYGTQGKLIPTGTISGSSWNAGVFGQLDISAATINAGQMAPIWGDYGASSGTLTDQTGLYGIAMTNTTAVVTQGQIYLYGGSQNLLLLETNAGLSGVTYFKDAGVSAGSWGNATPPTPSKVLKIQVDGTAYYLPLVAQNT